MIRFECPHCGQPVEVDHKFAGRRGRCPGCGGIVTIAAPDADASPSPGAAAESPAAGQAPPATRPPPSVFADQAADRGPRKLTLPESVLAVQPGPVDQRAVGSGRGLPWTALVLACLPLVSALGIVLSRAAATQARQSGDASGRRVAGWATRIGILMTVLSAALAVLVMISAGQERRADDLAEECLQSLSTTFGELESYAIEHQGRYPASLGDMEGSAHMYLGWGRFVEGDLCPETEREFGYVVGLKSEPKSSKIVLYDSKPSHGCRTLLWGRPQGRNVCRSSGATEFLAEEQFQRQMAAQAVPPAPQEPPPGPEDRRP